MCLEHRSLICVERLKLTTLQLECENPSALPSFVSPDVFGAVSTDTPAVIRTTRTTCSTVVPTTRARSIRTTSQQYHLQRLFHRPSLRIDAFSGSDGHNRFAINNGISGLLPLTVVSRIFAR